MEQIIPWKEILLNPASAWAIFGILVFVYVMNQNGKREERLMDILNGSLKDHGLTISKQTSTLENINNSVVNLHQAVCKVEERVDDIEEVLQINKVVEK